MFKIQPNRLMNNLVKILLISTFFDAYCLFYISSYPVTLFTIVSILIVIVGVVIKLLCQRWELNRQERWAIIFLLYTALNYVLFSFSNLNAFLQVIFFVIVFTMSKRYLIPEDFGDYIAIFHKAMNILSVYGIYQFFGRLQDMPFTDLTISNHMVAGYNWSNTTFLLGMIVHRSNAIFREPSFFGQFLAINILFYIVALFDGRRDNHAILCIAVNGLALLTTLSGTGFIVLGLGFFIYVLFKFRNKNFLKHSIGYIVGILIIVIAIIGFSPVGKYLTSRISELFVYDKDASAGFVRFRAWTSLLQGEWRKHSLIGIGIGSSKELVNKWSSIYYGFTLNGFAKILIELGIIGIVLWMIFIISFFCCQIKKYSNYALMIVCFLVPYMICHDTFSSNAYWIFLVLLNCNIFKYNMKTSN